MHGVKPTTGPLVPASAMARRRLMQTLIGGVCLGLARPVPAIAATPQASNVRVEVPPVHLLRQDGRTVALPRELDDGRAVYLHFIFTSCAAICPAASQLFAQLQRRLGERARGVHLVSFSIDPENDTPARLRDYAAEHGAGAGWDHYTGSVEDSIRVQRAFGAWRGDKMNHLPAVWFRPAPGSHWRRMDGFLTPGDLLAQL